ncbi:DUF4124 domain-containing protein [Streptomyces sp. SCSIO ZS0520]|uniref:Rv1733c family protein n=1 Tax=Streptomyces sp. SCSIO ZS0520 TaxID=2892996 RepID=UPI0021D97FAF|nr:DUF4124 domain-containing protein [Streptomyces sp. SCSIO ZS0520]
MAATVRTGRWLWHWRHNDLRRPSDRAEGWILLAALALAVTGGAASGALAAGVVVDSAEEQQSARREVTATVTEAASRASPDDTGFGDDRVRTAIRWRDDGGRVHHSDTKVPPNTEKGAEVPLWVDRDGRPASAPPSTGELLGGAAATGGLTALGVAGGVLLTERGARYALDRRRIRQWEREWEVVGPYWRRKAL